MWIPKKSEFELLTLDVDKESYLSSQIDITNQINSNMKIKPRQINNTNHYSLDNLIDSISYNDEEHLGVTKNETKLDRANKIFEESQKK